ncbi:hypothetical protein MLD38_000540 [Melastoma candidum]|uniref:Uncharacterized protein n=1 Tax=Melastoma candidum TaxID=119954 RepID=A0ACB9SBP3_9MYRT|nr:hypothetical protein MLD38_000540 [Melastoma candidum]
MKLAGAAKPLPAARRRTRAAPRSGGHATRRGSSLPETPLLKWKTDEKERNRSVLPVEDDDEGDDAGPRSGGRGRDSGFSARKIAAGLWRSQSQSPEEGGVNGGAPWGDGSCKGKSGAKHIRSRVSCHRNRKLHVAEEKDAPDSPQSVSSMTKGFLFKLEPSFRLSSSAMEGATKWDPDPASFKLADEVNKMHSCKKLLDQQANAASVISALESELEQARSRIAELETERRSSKKKLEHFLKKVTEEKAAWRRREHEKVRAFLDDIKSDLSREKKNRQRMEIVNSKLVDELAEAKLSTKRLMQEYEKERKTRALVEEVCDELAKEIGEDKAEVDALKKETTRLREEVDEERKMLQMAEVWREERVQMKLLDAKVALEEKYSQMNRLVADLESFCQRSRNVMLMPEEKDIREAEFLMKASSSVNIQDLKEFTYEPSDPDDIFAVFEEVALGGNNNARESGQCVAYSPASHASKIHTVSPEVNGIIKDNGDISRHQMGSMSHNVDVEEDESGWETVSNLEDQGSSYSMKSFDDGQRNNDALGGEPQITEISEVCSVPVKQPKRVSSIVRLWKSNAENCKLVSMEGMNGRFSNGKISNGGIGSPDHWSGKGGFIPADVVGQCSPPEIGNAQISRGTKGCIEWPRGPYKSGLKAKLLAARMESQKVQLKHVLKQKM